MSKTFETANGHALTVYTLGSAHQLYITARNFRMYAVAALTNEDAPAFALAVLESAYKDEGGHLLAAIDDLRSHIKQQAKAEDAMKLRNEARKLYEVSGARMGKQGLTTPPWEKAGADNIAHWEHIARAARELHGK